MSLNPIAGPVQAGERIQVIDVLRGFALLGILLVNMESFALPAEVVMDALGRSPGTLDRIAAFIVRWLAEGKFYSLFSFLFGLGFSILMLRMQAKGRLLLPFYARRLLALLVFGLLHALLIWNGDILVAYALIGWLLLLFRKAQPRTLLIWVIGLLTLAVLLKTVGSHVFDPYGAATPGEKLFNPDLQDGTGFKVEAQAYQIYAEGSFREITRQRFFEYFNFVGSANLSIVPSILAMFLLGLYFGRREIFQNTGTNRSLFNKLLIWGYGVGLPANFLFAFYYDDLTAGGVTPLTALSAAGKMLGAPLLMLAYVATLVILFENPIWKKRLIWLAPGGRMALSNYLGQSVICTLIFYGYGLGLYGQVNRAISLLLAFLIFALQIGLSIAWFKFFAYGPAEWLWRYLTYLKKPALLSRDFPKQV